MVVADLQPDEVHVAEGDVLQLNCSVKSSAEVTCPALPLNLSDVTIRRRSTGAALSGQVRLIEDGVAQFTLETAVRISDGGNVYCSLGNITGNTALVSPWTHIYVFSQYTFISLTHTDYLFTVRACSAV